MPDCGDADKCQDREAGGDEHPAGALLEKQQREEGQDNEEGLGAGGGAELEQPAKVARANTAGNPPARNR